MCMYVWLLLLRVICVPIEVVPAIRKRSSQVLSLCVPVVAAYMCIPMHEFPCVPAWLLQLAPGVQQVQQAPTQATKGGVTCGTGTKLEGTSCVPVVSQQATEVTNAAIVTCGTGTELQGTNCVSVVSPAAKLTASGAALLLAALAFV